jgi:hypothetical protein
MAGLRTTPHCHVSAQRDGGSLVRHGWMESNINMRHFASLNEFATIRAIRLSVILKRSKQ